MQNSKSTLIKLAVGEVLVCVVTVLCYLGLGKFDFTVISGAAFGFVVAMLYYIFLDISANRAIDNVLAERGQGELSEEEIDQFVKDNQKKLQQRMQVNFYIRIGIILAAFVIAFLTKWFAVIATLVPLLAVSPLLMLFEYFKKGDK